MTVVKRLRELLGAFAGELDQFVEGLADGQRLFGN